MSTLPIPLALVLLIFPAAALARTDPAFFAYHTALTRQCAVKHLGWLPPEIMAGPAQDFLDALPRQQRDQADRRIAAECPRGGAACTDLAVIHAAAKLKVVSRLATVVCREDYLCTAVGRCRETPP
jgi:hypothetical protein